jgi:hypothetical protein
MMFLGGWLLHSIRLAAALGLALVAMQAPAVTREYQAALLQLVRSSEEEIAQRKASAERFYGIAPGEDDGVQPRSKCLHLILAQVSHLNTPPVC